MLEYSDRSQRQAKATGPAAGQPALIQSVVQQGLINEAQAIEAADIAQRQGLRLADVLCRRYGISEYSIARIIAEVTQACMINPLEDLPDLSLLERYAPALCLRQGVMPWRQIGPDTVVLTSRPDQFDRFSGQLRDAFGDVRMAIATEDQLLRSITQHCSASLVHQAEQKVPDAESCRKWNSRFAFLVGLLACAAVAAGLFLAPQLLLTILTGWAVLTLFLNMLLKSAAALIGWNDPPPPKETVIPARLPLITMLVPLYNEKAIAEHLLTRLKALEYPQELLDVCLVLEADDLTTRKTLGRTILPTWMRPIIVPKGTIKTKPRALNYALDFARGSIIGVWDAEDAPAPDQLHVVARRFANCGPDVACLQGILDYYNAGTNWLTRCFAVEYAGWFRVILPGLQKLGLVVPLGGTTLFFRRSLLEKLGGWDAHNVTEDADLGVRLARHGYRTELIPTVTEEEANGRPWPWVKQRSRWLKGYAITYGVHMRRPGKLWQDLGIWRFLGLQMLFLGTLSQFVLAPLLWTFWLLPFGFPHPLDGLIASWMVWMLAGLFITSELVGLAVATIGLRKAGKLWLAKWAITMQFYFPLAAVAAYKGLFELATKPFYWDKTAHGILLPDGWERPTPRLQPQLRPVSDG